MIVMLFNFKIAVHPFPLNSFLFLLSSSSGHLQQRFCIETFQRRLLNSTPHILNIFFFTYVSTFETNFMSEPALQSQMCGFKQYLFFCTGTNAAVDPMKYIKACNMFYKIPFIRNLYVQFY